MARRTKLMKIVYPSPDEEPFQDSHAQGMDKIDQIEYANSENGNLVWTGGGTVSWNAGTDTLTWSSDIKITGMTTGARFGVIPAAGILIEDGEVVFFAMPRFLITDQNIEIIRSNRIFDSNNELNDLRLFVTRVGSKLFFGNSLSLIDGNSGILFGAGIPGAGPPTGAAGGDLGGTYPSPEVLAITALEAGAADDVIKNDGAGGWVVGAAPGGPPTGAAGGELAGTYPNPTVVDGADGTAIHDNVAGEIAAITLKGAPVAGDLLVIEDSAAANVKKRITVGSLPGGGGGALTTTNINWVDSAGNDGTAVPNRADLPYLTIGAALGAAASGDTVIVRPGTYAEEGLTVPSGVSLRGEGGWQVTTLGFTAGRAADLLTINDDVTIQGLTLLVSASASFAAVTYSGGGGSDTAAMYEIRFLGDGAAGAGVGIEKTGTGKIIGSEIRFDAGGIGRGIFCDSGAVALEGLHYPPATGTFTTGARVEGTGRLQLVDFNVGNSNIVDCFEVAGTSTLLAFGLNVTNVTNIVHIEADGVFVGLFGGKMTSSALDFLVDPALTGVGTTVQVTTAHSGNYSFPPAALATDFELAYFQETSPIESAQFTIFGPDISFGFPEKGSHTAIGRGRSYVKGMRVFTSDNTAGPGSDGGNLTDITSDAQSTSGSTFTFQGAALLSTNTSILFTSERTDASGNQLPFWGVSMEQAIAGVGGSYIFEVRTAPNTWVPVGFQAVAYESDYRYGRDVFIRAGQREDIRFGLFNSTPDPRLPDGTAWPITTVSGVAGRWARFRVSTILTTKPTFERLSISPSHCEFNEEGERVAHGLAMWRHTISTGGNIFGESGGVVQANQPVGSGGLPTGWTHPAPNSELNQPADAIYYQFALQDGLCTAYPISLNVVYTLEGSQPVTVAPVGIVSMLPVQVAGVDVADPAGGLLPTARTLANTESLTGKVAQTDTQNLTGGATLPATLNDKALSTSFGPFDISGYYEDDLIYIRLELDSDGTPVQDLRVMSIIISAVAFSEGAPI